MKRLLFATCCLITLSHVFGDDLPMPSPPGSPSAANIPRVSGIVEDLLKVVEKAKSRWDAFQQGYGSGYVPEFLEPKPNILLDSGIRGTFLRSLLLGNILFPNRRRSPSRVDPQVPHGAMSRNLDSPLLTKHHIPQLPIPYEIHANPYRRSGFIAPSGAYVPKNVSPGTKLVHRPATPISNCLYGDVDCLEHYPINLNDWEDLFTNMQLTEY